MDSKIFQMIVLSTVEELKGIARENPTYITSCKSGDDFEIRVIDALTLALANLNIEANIHHSPGSHAFPDIILEAKNGAKYGIEVKSSSAVKAKGWKINGNSVMGSTRDPDVVETYIIFGKTSRAALDFKARKYEDCVANVVVTHSPRYLIDMDLPENNTFFDKSGIKYKAIITSKNPIGLITNYFQKIGQKAWWLSESTPAAIRMFNEIPTPEQSELIGYGFAHFPELFERNNTKYKRFALWLVTERSIVNPSLRDSFSASGQVNLTLNGTTYNRLPKIFQRLFDEKESVISALVQADPEILQQNWNTGTKPKNNLRSKLDAWISITASCVCESQLPKDVKPISLLQDIFSEYI